MPSGKPPNPQKAEMLEMLAGGMRKIDIARALGVRYAAVIHATAGMRRSRQLTAWWAIKRGGYRAGSVSSNVTPECMAIVAKKIIGDETILDCMARLVVQCYGNETKKETK